VYQNLIKFDHVVVELSCEKRNASWRGGQDTDLASLLIEHVKLADVRRSYLRPSITAWNGRRHVMNVAAFSHTSNDALRLRRRVLRI
jgi:hypothetical protein